MTRRTPSDPTSCDDLMSDDAASVDHVPPPLIAGIGTEPIEATWAELTHRYDVKVLAGPDAGKEISSVGQAMVIGTHERANLILTDKTVSRFHCEVETRHGRTTIRDLDSMNGTSLNGVEVMSAVLKTGAIVEIGKTKLQFEERTTQRPIDTYPRTQWGTMVGGSKAMRAVFRALSRYAKTDLSILIHGETGTGKELAAESIHLESDRRDGPIIVVDCGALPANLLESELFGHIRGSFTGAIANRVGAFEAANGGTLFLDEIGELPLDLQPKLLRVLEERKFKPVGTHAYRSTDVRVVAATHRDLRQQVNAGDFRSDLYFRIAVAEVTLPPLRDRLDDLPMLVEAIVKTFSSSSQSAAEAVIGEAMLTELRRHRWPGNVRELRNYLERSIALGESAPLGLQSAENVAQESAVVVDLERPLRDVRDQWVARIEKQYLEGLLEKTGDNVSAAARAAGLDRAYLYRLLWRHGLRTPASGD